MPVVIGGWDSPENVRAAMERGEIIGTMPPSSWGLEQEIAAHNEQYVNPAPQPPAPGYIATADKGAAIGNTLFGTMQSASPGIMTNVVLAGQWSGFDPNDIAGGLAIIKAYSLDVYGSTELGTVRYSSEVLENEPTGVRPGTMERIVIPAWARRERGSPL